MYFCHMVINSIFENNLAEAKTYYDMVKELYVTNKRGERVLPFYYYVPADFIEDERVNQGTQKRLPSREVEADSTHLWTQSIVFICELLGKFVCRTVLFLFISILSLTQSIALQSKRFSCFKISTQYDAIYSLLRDPSSQRDTLTSR